MGLHKDREKNVTYGIDHHRSTDWATRPEREQVVGIEVLFHHIQASNEGVCIWNAGCVELITERFLCKSLVNKLNFKFSQTRNIFATYKGSHLILVVLCGIAWFLINQNPCFCTILCNELHFISDLYCINQKVDKNYFHDYFIADEWLTDNGAEINSTWFCFKIT